jgi:SAM-dependent methyltransferase
MDNQNGMDEIIKEWNKNSDSEWYASYRTDEVINGIIANPASVFHPTTFAMLSKYLGGFKGKKILVPSSGDNHAVFGFALLGADVTSTDISPRQIENAKTIAIKRGWNIRFAVDNTMTLETIADSEYDLVFTSNGVFVWINDLPAMFGNIRRVLKDGGYYVFRDIHPFTRPFSEDDPANLPNSKIIVKKPYDQPDMSIEGHWRVSDLLNPLIESGLTVKQIKEMFPEFGTYWFESTGGRKGMSEEQLQALYDWRKNPLAAIPAWLSVVAKK